MDFDLNEDQRAFQQSARDFARHEMAAKAAQWDSEAIFPRDVIAQAGELGFCGLLVPQELGGMGLSRLDAVIVFEELARACPSTTAYLTIHNMASWTIANWATPSLQRDWVPLLASGAMLASYCLTEPGAGSDAASLRTTAMRDGDDFILNGSKAFISGAGATDVLVVMARSGGAGADGISAFAVPADLPGIRYGRKEEKMGWNSQPTRGISFDNVRIHRSHLLGAEGEGFRIAMRGLDGGRLN
ncbi:MAG: acyl-CoA dehydrogenase family protein, partial [Burkholderiales bacterium]|nr:acyl-CoA dehydrogenase family protein [Burkholderiales bacterium]